MYFSRFASLRISLLRIVDSVGSQVDILDDTCSIDHGDSYLRSQMSFRQSKQY